MRSLFILLLAVGFFRCNPAGENDKKNADADTITNTVITEQNTKIEPVKGTAADIPASVKLAGKLVEVWKWKDKMGDNLLITSVVAPYKDNKKNEYGEEGFSAEVHAVHYAGMNGAFQQVWSVSEKETSCPFDVTSEFIKDAISITDLDADQVAETTIQYKTACRSDVSPAAMKLVMHQGATAYSLRGLMWINAGDGEKFTVTENDANLEKLQGYKGTEEEYMKTFGRYESEKEFAAAPKEFLSHARSRWIKFAVETF